MSVRHATEADLARLVELCRVMHAEAPNLNHTALDEAKVAKTLDFARAGGLLLVHEGADGVIDGFFAGVLTERWFSRDPYFTDLGLFVDPARRGGLAAYRMLRLAIQWCEAKGLNPKDVTLGISTGVHPETTGKLFEQLGFERRGGLYQLGAY